MIIIKSKKEIECIRKACNIVSQTFEYIAGIIKPGITTAEIDKEIESFITGKNARPAFKGYRGFPSSACISVNEVVIHGIPDGTILREGDIAGVDIGVEKDGCFGDSAYTYNVGEIDGKADTLLSTTKKALFRAIEVAEEGNRIGDISSIIQETAESAGFNVVKEYVGHGVGLQLHEDPPIPNIGKSGRGPRLKPGMTVAIEPMINSGKSDVKVLDDGWTVVTQDGQLSAHFEHTILITNNKAEVLTSSTLY